jgi:hypothetical protein
MKIIGRFVLVMICAISGYALGLMSDSIFTALSRAGCK